MSDTPTLRAIAESGDVIDDPSEDALFMMMEAIDAGEGTYLIVEALSDPSGHTYAQTLRHDDGTYAVEYRDGGPDSHFGAVAPDMRAAHAFLTAWAFQVPGWREWTAWERVTI